jgi:hypothetical protein
MKSRSLLFATALTALAFASPAKADLIFSGVVNTTALGFGDVHRLQDIQEPTGQGTGIEAGTVSPTAITITPTVCTGGAICSGSGDKSSTPTLTALGWTTGSNVGVGVDISQTGANDGLNLNSLVINIYDPTGTTIVDTFQLGAPYLITAEAGHASGSGNGQGVFQFVLDSAQVAEFNSDLLNGNDVVGSSVNWGCSGTASATCQPANDGPDTLLGFKAAAVPAPIVGAGLPGLISACLGLWGFNRFRRKRRVA